MILLLFEEMLAYRFHMYGEFRNKHLELICHILLDYKLINNTCLLNVNKITR